MKCKLLKLVLSQEIKALLQNHRAVAAEMPDFKQHDK